MTNNSILTLFSQLIQFNRHQSPPALNSWEHDQQHLPRFVRRSAVAMKYLKFLSPLAWDQLPQRAPPPHSQQPAISYAAFCAAYLIKLDQQLVSMSHLRDYLLDHPELVWLLGFPCQTDHQFQGGFDPQQSLPTARHFTRLLRHTPNEILQRLLDSTVQLLQTELAQHNLILGESISLDTKHILAWVTENNPKSYVTESQRLDKTRQPNGDADCKLGCKRKRNRPPASEQGQPFTPTQEPRPPTNFSPKDEYYWGYASGVVATKVPDWGEFVLAELTQTFDCDDLTYFFPLLHQVERRLGRKPAYGAMDAAFDAFYVYEYFYRAGGFAAVPFVGRGGFKQRVFDEQGLPLCQAGLPMPLKSTYWSKSTLVAHQAGRYACPLLFPQPTGSTCPLDHQNWPTGGCLTAMPTANGARIRHQLDRHSHAYKQLYNQRSATERINSQAKALGIERPKLRNRQAIANRNTLIYILINLRTLHRIRQKKACSNP
jgi:hypothetical protein